MTDSLGWSAQVHQATGMIVAQAGLDTTEALRVLVDHAAVAYRPVHDVAVDVIAGRVRFDNIDSP